MGERQRPNDFPQDLEPTDKNIPQALRRLNVGWKEGKFLCIGLDPDPDKIPKFEGNTQGDSRFLNAIISHTSDIALCYKPNLGFYEAQGVEGDRVLRNTFGKIDLFKKRVPNLISIADAKRFGSEEENVMQAKYIFDDLGADAVTLNPSDGLDSLQPFFDRKDKLNFLWLKSSNESGTDFQDLKVELKGDLQDLAEKVVALDGFSDRFSEGYVPLYLAMAHRAARDYNENGNIGLVVGATYPEELGWVRKIVGDIPILVPGIGSQGGSMEDVMKVGLNSAGGGLILSSTRDIIYAGFGGEYYSQTFDHDARCKAVPIYEQIKKIKKSLG